MATRACGRFAPHPTRRERLAREDGPPGGRRVSGPLEGRRSRTREADPERRGRARARDPSRARSLRRRAPSGFGGLDREPHGLGRSASDA
jgi:hypothetical protein